MSARLCLTLLHSLWQVALLATVAWCISQLRRKRSVETSYTLHVTVLIFGIAAVPITFAVVQVPIPTTIAAHAGMTKIHSASPPVDLTNTQASMSSGIENQPQKSQRDLSSATNPAPTPSVETPTEKAWFPNLLRAAPWLSIMYAGGVALMLLRLSVDIVRAEQLRSRADPIAEGPLVESLLFLSRQWSMRVVPALAQAEQAVVPRVVGLFKPTILLPTSALTGLSISEVEMILAHELAHVRRYDMWVNLLQRLSEVLLFFNPAMWYLSRRISTLREYCCDEVACRTIGTSNTQPRVQYATALLRVVEIARPNAAKQTNLAAIAADGRSPSELRRRVARLFGEPLREPMRLSRSGIFACAAIALLVTCGPTLLPTRGLTSESTVRDQQPEDEKTQGRARISGRIVLEDGSPATVEGRMSSTVRTHTSNGKTFVGSEGKFSDEYSIEVNSGTVWLSHFPDGMAPSWVGPLELKRGEHLNHVNVILKPGLSVQLRVQNKLGEPVAGATVVAHPEINGSAHGPVRKKTTDANGEYMLEHLADTRYAFRVTAPGYQPLRTEPLQIKRDEVLQLTMIRSEPTTGIVRFADGTPAPGAKLYYESEIVDRGWTIDYGDYDKLAATTGMTPESKGRFTLDQLASESHYLFVIEAVDGARGIVRDLKAEEKDVEIVLPRRRDLFVRITGDLSSFPKRDGKPYVSVRQRIDWRPAPHKQYGALIGGDVPIESTDGGGKAIYRGLAIETDNNFRQQQVEVSLNYPNGPKKIVDINPSGDTHVVFDLRKVSQSGVEDNRSRLQAPDDIVPEGSQYAPQSEADAAGTNGDGTRVALPIVVARHVLLLDGKEIITWDDLEQKVAALPNPSLAYPQFYITQGVRESGGDAAAREHIDYLNRKFELNGLSEGSLQPRSDARYDRIESAADLRPDPDLKSSGTIVDRSGHPVGGAEVILITPVDESISYKTYNMALVEGRVRNRLQHVITDSNTAGRFNLYPPKGKKYYVVALHPDAGFALVRSDQFETEREIKLSSWAGLAIEFDDERNEKQSASLTSRVEKTQGAPAVNFSQYWSDLNEEAPAHDFHFTHIPPILDTTIRRTFANKDDGGSIGISAASVGLLPGEVRQLDLGPLSEQQRSWLEQMRKR